MRNAPQYEVRIENNKTGYNKTVWFVDLVKADLYYLQQCNRHGIEIEPYDWKEGVCSDANSEGYCIITWDNHNNGAEDGTVYGALKYLLGTFDNSEEIFDYVPMEICLN